jgi:hypothetical protein
LNVSGTIGRRLGTLGEAEYAHTLRHCFVLTPAR